MADQSVILTLSSGSVNARVGSSGPARSASRQRAQELDHRGADLGRSLLLHPVTATGQHDSLAKVGDHRLQRFDPLPAAGHKVELAITGDEQGGDADRGVVPGGGQLPVRSMFRYQLSPPVKPEAANAGRVGVLGGLIHEYEYAA